MRPPESLFHRFPFFALFQHLTKFSFFFRFVDQFSDIYSALLTVYFGLLTVILCTTLLGLNAVCFDIFLQKKEFSVKLETLFSIPKELNSSKNLCCVRICLKYTFFAILGRWHHRFCAPFHMRFDHTELCFYVVHFWR